MFFSMPELMRRAGDAACVRIGAVALLALVALPVNFARAEGITLVRDAETERMLRDYSLPIWRAAGMTPSAITIHLVKDPNINAFVISGQDVFLTPASSRRPTRRWKSSA